MERHKKEIQLASSGKYYEQSTDLLGTLEKTDERITLNWAQPGGISVFIYKQRLQRIRLCFFLHRFNQRS